MKIFCGDPTTLSQNLVVETSQTPGLTLMGVNIVGVNIHSLIHSLWAFL